MDGLPWTPSATQEQLALGGGAERTGTYPQRVLGRPTRPATAPRPEGCETRRQQQTKVYQRNRDAPMPLNEVPVNGLPIPRLTEVFFFNIHNLHPGASIGLPLLFRVP